MAKKVSSHEQLLDEVVQGHRLGDHPYLLKAGSRQNLFQYLAKTFERSTFAFTLARYRLVSKYSRNKLGIFWVVLRPLLNALVYGLIFGLLMGSRRPENFVSFLIIGVFFYEFFSSTVNSGAKSITGNENLIRSLTFPRMTLPLSTLLQQFLNLAVMIAVLLVLLLLFGNPIDVSWLMLIPIILIYAVFSFGVALIAARLSSEFLDFNNLLPFILRLGMYGSGVLFALDNILGDYPELLAVVSYNPVYGFLSLARGALLQGYEMSGFYWIVCSVAAVLFLIIGTIYFWLGEERYGRPER